MSHFFTEVLKRRKDLIHERDVWEELVRYLQGFLDTDASAAKMGVKSTAGLSMVVPQEVVERVRDKIQAEQIETLFANILAIDSSEVKDGKDPKGGKEKSRKKASGQEEGSGKKSAAKSRRRTPKAKPKPKGDDGAASERGQPANG